MLIGRGQGSNLEEGIVWYNKRADGASNGKALPAPIDRSIDHFKKAMLEPGAEEMAAYYLLQCYYYKGTFTEVSKDEAKAIYKDGKELGERMLAKYPESPEILYWHFVDLGKWGETYGKIAAAKEGVADQLKEAAEKLIRVDPDYRDGGGNRLLGILHFEAPYIPFFLTWPDDDEAIKHLERSFEYNPDHINGLLYYAKVLEDNGDKEKAIKTLEKLIRLPVDPTNLLEDQKDIKEARELLEKYKK